MSAVVLGPAAATEATAFASADATAFAAVDATESDDGAGCWPWGAGAVNCRERSGARAVGGTTDGGTTDGRTTDGRTTDGAAQT